MKNETHVSSIPDASQRRPWYREVYLWLVLSPLVMALFSGLGLVWAASQVTGDDTGPQPATVKVGRLISDAPVPVKDEGRR